MPQEETASVRATLKVNEAAAILGSGERGIRNLIAQGVLPHIRIGRNILIPRSAFLRWIDQAGK